MIRKACRYLFSSIVMATVFLGVCAAEEPISIQVHWDKVLGESKTKASLLVVATPALRRGTVYHDRAFQAIKSLGADDVRFVPWQGYPHLGVPELDSPTRDQTFWDFSYIDPIAEDFMSASNGHPVVVNFSTIPQWMFKTAEPVRYPADPNGRMLNYEQGQELRDPTFREAADYFARVVSWYVKGGFTDELGKRRASGHHYKFDYWEVLNEPDIEHGFDVQTYTRLYDAIVEAVHKVSPQTKFVGISLSYPSGHPEFFEYFLDHRNHRPGVPLDMISYHFYAVPGRDQSPEVQQYTYFDQADKFLEIVGYIESIRKRLSPHTGTMVNEIGSMLPDDWLQGNPDYVFKPIPASYWNLSAAVYAYVYLGLTRLGIDVAGASEIPAYPGLFPSIALLDWDTGQPNARWHVLWLIHRHFAPGDKLVETPGGAEYVAIQGFITPTGERKLLLVNRRDREFEFRCPEAAGGQLEVVDRTTGPDPPLPSRITGETFKLPGLGVAVVTLPR